MGIDDALFEVLVVDGFVFGIGSGEPAFGGVEDEDGTEEVDGGDYGVCPVGTSGCDDPPDDDRSGHLAGVLSHHDERGGSRQRTFGYQVGEVGPECGHGKRDDGSGGESESEHVPRLDDVEGDENGLDDGHDRQGNADGCKEFAFVEAVDDCARKDGEDEDGNGSHSGDDSNPQVGVGEGVHDPRLSGRACDGTDVEKGFGC